MLRLTIVNIKGNEEIADYECHVEITENRRLKTLAKFEIKDFVRAYKAEGLLLKAAYDFMDIAKKED